MITSTLIGSMNMPSAISSKLIRMTISQGGRSSAISAVAMPWGTPSRVSMKALNSPPISSRMNIAVVRTVLPRMRPTTKRSSLPQHAAMPSAPAAPTAPASVGVATPK